MFDICFKIFVCVLFFVPFEFFHSRGDQRERWIHSCERWKLYRPSYARRSWAVGVLLACHTYWETVRLFIYMYDHLSASVCQWHYLYLFKQFKTVATGIRTPTKPPHARRTLQPTAPPVACISFSLYELSLTFCIKIEEGQDV